MAHKKGKNKGYSYRYNESGTITCRAYFDMPNGTRKQLSATGKTEQDSQNKIKQKYAEICKKGKIIKPSTFTVKSWLNYWLTDVKCNLKGNTRDSYYNSFKNYIIPLLGNIKLKDLSLSQIQIAINKVKEIEITQNGKKQKLTGKTVKEIFAPFKQALYYAMNDNKMNYINLAMLDMPQVKKGTRSIRNDNEQQIVTDYFCNKIQDKPFDLYYAPIAVIDARGLRPEECAGLRWEDIDYENDSFWAGRHTIVKNGVYDENGKKIGNKLVIEDSGKTPQAFRELPLGKFLSNIFKLKYKEYLDRGIKPQPTDFIFYTKAGNPFYEQSLRKMYKSLAKKLGIAEIGCYSLRHEYLTYLAQETDTDQETIKQLAGWSEIVSTYFHTDDKHKRKAVCKVDSQYENSIEIEEKDIEKNNNIIQFPFKKVVNK